MRRVPRYPSSSRTPITNCLELIEGMPERGRGRERECQPACPFLCPQLRFQTSQTSLFILFHLTASSNKCTVNPVHRQTTIETARIASRRWKVQEYSTNCKCCLMMLPALPAGERSSPPRPRATDVGEAPPSWRTPANSTRTPKSCRQNWTDMCSFADLIPREQLPQSYSRNRNLPSIPCGLQCNEKFKFGI